VLEFAPDVDVSEGLLREIDDGGIFVSLKDIVAIEVITIS
jgi:hypothetical protein